MAKVTFNTPALSNTSAPAMPDFSRVCKELHDKLIEAGMVAATDTGQLDFAAMAAMTLTPSTQYGYRIYQLSDGIGLPVFLKIRFASQNSIGTGNRQPWVLNISIGLGTNGAGGLTQATAEYTVGADTSYQNTDDSKAGLPLTSLICCKTGFLGVSWKQGITPVSASYAPSSADSIGIANFFICRDTDDSGAPTAEGVSLVVIAPGGTSYMNYGASPVVAHISATGTVIASRRTCMFLGGDTLTTIDGKLPLFHVYTLTPTPRRIAQLLIVAKPVGSVGNDELDSRSVGTAERHFIAMNTCWPADVYSGTGARAAIAMLWED